jgi:hypothetical protein
MTRGSITKTYTPQNFSKNTIPPPLRLDDQMFKRATKSSLRIRNLQRSHTMSTTPINESTRVNSPIDERTSIAGFPYLGYPPRVSTPVLRRTVINATQLQAEAAAEAIITDSERWGMPVARQQERVGQAAVHAAMIVQSALIFDLPTSQAIRMFAPRSPPASINTLPRTPADTPSPEPLPIPPR